MKYHLSIFIDRDGKIIDFSAANLNEAEILADMEISSFCGKTLILSGVNGDGPVERHWETDKSRIFDNEHPIEFENGFYSDWKFGDLALQAREAKKKFDDLSKTNKRKK